MLRGPLDALLRTRGLRAVRDGEIWSLPGQRYLKQLCAMLDFDCVFDVGGNAGQYGQMLRGPVGYRNRLISVEPIPEVAAELRQVAAAAAPWEVFECALGAERGRATFNVAQGSEFSSLLAPSAEQAARYVAQSSTAKRIDVEIRTFADLFREAEQRQAILRPLLKIDTQGTELDVIAGARELLPRIPAIQLELSFERIYDGAPDYRQVIDALAADGYRLSSLFPNNDGQFPRLVEMDAVFVRAELLTN